MKKWGIKPYLLGLLLLSFLHFIYGLRTNNYFSVDDFFVIQYFRDHSVLGIIPDFLVNGDINEFRKITGFLVFGGLLKSFGLNPFAFDFAMFTTHTITLFLLFLVVRKITKKDFASFFVSILFNKNYLFYYSNIHENLLALFSILTVFIFLYYPKKFYLSAASFLLALFSKETAVTVPLVLLAISLFYKPDNQSITFFRKRALYLLIGSLFFGIYAAYLFVVKKVIGENPIYMPTSRIQDLIQGYNYFVDYKIITVLTLSALYLKKYNYIPLLIVFFVTLTPAAILVHRREIYYLYMPFLFLMIYLSKILPKISFKNSLIYLFFFVIFGNRSILPKIAWQEFPNWQKVSIDQVLDRVEVGNNDFSDLILERDAKLMIGSGTTDLFLKEWRKTND